jgi:hypothetical protein
VWREAICTAALLLAVRPVLADPVPDAQAWRKRESWQHLARGMSRFDVFRILGEPGKVASYDGFERWEYPDMLGGRVNFNDAGQVVGWRLPQPPRPPAAPGR